MRLRRPLYEALLRLEREGAAVVDRPLHGEDIALSAETCCCIWTEASLKACCAKNSLHVKPWRCMPDLTANNAEATRACPPA